MRLDLTEHTLGANGTNMKTLSYRLMRLLNDIGEDSDEDRLIPL